MRKVGHTGTLDPGATGLLVLCLGQATRLSDFLTGSDKEYEGVLRLGVVTSSHDLQGDVIEERPVPPIGEDDLKSAFEAFTGTIMQRPPMVSAVKIGGERLYKRALRGEEIERPPRQVTVHEFSVLSFNGRDATFRLRCSSGTYARVLCYDVGERLGCGGTLAALRRTKVGMYSISDGLSLDKLDSRDAVRNRLLPMDKALALPSVILQNHGSDLVKHGHSIGREAITGDCPVDAGWVQVKTRSGELLALAEVARDEQGLRIQPRRVFSS
jgi:tRNA pseudouridine55 synthase